MQLSTVLNWTTHIKLKHTVSVCVLQLCREFVFFFIIRVRAKGAMCVYIFNTFKAIFACNYNEQYLHQWTRYTLAAPEVTNIQYTQESFDVNNSFDKSTNFPTIQCMFIHILEMCVCYKISNSNAPFI